MRASDINVASLNIRVRAFKFNEKAANVFAERAVGAFSIAVGAFDVSREGVRCHTDESGMSTPNSQESNSVSKDSSPSKRSVLKKRYKRVMITNTGCVQDVQVMLEAFGPRL